MLSLHVIIQPKNYDILVQGLIRLIEYIYYQGIPSFPKVYDG
jgi:hypothetical protein